VTVTEEKDRRSSGVVDNMSTCYRRARVGYAVRQSDQPDLPDSQRTTDKRLLQQQGTVLIHRATVSLLIVTRLTMISLDPIGTSLRLLLQRFLVTF